VFLTRRRPELNQAAHNRNRLVTAEALRTRLCDMLAICEQKCPNDLIWTEKIHLTERDEDRPDFPGKADCRPDKRNVAGHKSPSATLVKRTKMGWSIGGFRSAAHRSGSHDFCVCRCLNRAISRLSRQRVRFSVSRSGRAACSSFWTRSNSDEFQSLLTRCRAMSR
jgi:hypothetical protein